MAYRNKHGSWYQSNMIPFHRLKQPGGLTFATHSHDGSMGRLYIYLYIFMVDFYGFQVGKYTGNVPWILWVWTNNFAETYTGYKTMQANDLWPKNPNSYFCVEISMFWVVHCPSLVVEPTHFKHMSQIGSLFSRFGVKIPNIWNHHPGFYIGNHFGLFAPIFKGWVALAWLNRSAEGLRVEEHLVTPMTPLNPGWLIGILVVVCYNPYMGVSENSGTPKSSILIGFSIIKYYKSFILGYPYFWKHLYNWIVFHPLYTLNNQVFGKLLTCHDAFRWSRWL